MMVEEVCMSVFDITLFCHLVQTDPCLDDLRVLECACAAFVSPSPAGRDFQM